MQLIFPVSEKIRHKGDIYGNILPIPVSYLVYQCIYTLFFPKYVEMTLFLDIMFFICIE